MVKKIVYLDESQAAALKRLAVRTGRSQAEIIRKAWLAGQGSAAGADREVVLTATIVFASLVALWGGLIPLRRRAG